MTDDDQVPPEPVLPPRPVIVTPDTHAVIQENMKARRSITAIAHMTITAQVTAEGQVTAPVTTAGLETEHSREIRYTARDEDGARYVEVVDGEGQYIAGGRGEAADALTDRMLYLLPPDHPDYPTEPGSPTEPKL